MAGTGLAEKFRLLLAVLMQQTGFNYLPLANAVCALILGRGIRFSASYSLGLAKTNLKSLREA